MAQVKNNYAVLQPALSYEIQDQGEAAMINCLGASKLTANQLLAAAAKKPRLPGRLEQACEFLLDFLQSGARPTTEIWAAAQKRAISERTLRCARKKANIDCVRIHDKKRLYYGYLPGHEPPGEAADKAELLKLLAPIIEEFPSTPIDPA